ncbi:bifunctional 23S rRNA (guanine(2069)-N(7))-methyltransferase RlmK/23S rRNA (guanine(2445)-N(2))-methyltransferase RlmL [Thalassotalea sp. M1531]|uniref:Ribosomal RNA large subunit methyltransferase K/L n=1 Tax=Thalassotalea algicola TaxID=2716224 RepID=A0A7Y0Q6R2_9GAMM|nr:bifunctional 23S rRNA (guanine(2069)-N(7))-methyltransferase RlmK/23S rRNA (guanine(2445)-N(2))-methyltransferase RlmL [Thalassotalea algicola]NMP32284.1 bifunctional 23S rRNA (guanine(2069)-N(7))-methyltransferase RlmK/23S rRNA (guanine(2445)-N(2))-methyltransferase RlmL [Thalassotalea algicola]
MYQFLALTSPGIEILLAEEIQQLGGENVVQKPEGVYFTASLETAYNICLWTRLATRVLLKLSEADVKTKDDLYNATVDVDWLACFEPTHSFAVDFVGKSEEIRNSQFGGLTVKDGIVDKFRDAGFERPSVDKSNPDIRIQARLLKGQVSFYLDFSGRGLFQRGYRKDSGAAPLKENLAAAMVLRSGWLNDTTKPLVDPMCGSGTVLIEAVSMAAGQAPGLERDNWGFEFWLGHDDETWQDVFESVKVRSVESYSQFTGKVYGSDIDSRVVNTAKQNARKAGLSNQIEFSCKDAGKINNVFSAPGVMLFNPPYGERIGELPELVELFGELGQKLKQQYHDWRVAILTANAEILNLLKLATSKRYKFKNGPLDCIFAIYELDEKQLSRDAALGNVDLSNQNSDFANRVKKNIKSLKGWIKSENVTCYRVYDADIPEYNVAVDLYNDYLVIQEYAAPAKIAPEKVAKRLQEVLFWAPKVTGIETSKVVLKTRQKQKGSSQYQKLNKKNQSLIIDEYGAKLKVNLWDYLDTGLFLDHRKTRQIVARKAKDKTFLNLFAYTGSVSVQAALHGAAKVTTVDMSNTYLQWAEENFALNKLVSHKYQFIQADCLNWLKENEEKYQFIFIDPPTFSNSKRMEDSFDVQRDHVDMITDAVKSLTDDGEIMFTNNKRNFKIDNDAMQELGLKVECLTDKTRDKDFARNKHIHNSWLLTRINK